jgi:hypothetical protein
VRTIRKHRRIQLSEETDPSASTYSLIHNLRRKRNGAVGILKASYALGILGVVVAILCITLLSLVPGYVQTTSISNLNYPHQIALGQQVTIRFTVSFSRAIPGQDMLGVLIVYRSTNRPVLGTVQGGCQPVSSSAICVAPVHATQGTVDIQMNLNLDSAMTYSLTILASLGKPLTTGNFPVPYPGSISQQNLSITVT